MPKVTFSISSCRSSFCKTRKTSCQESVKHSKLNKIFFMQFRSYSSIHHTLYEVGAVVRICKPAALVLRNSERCLLKNTTSNLKSRLVQRSVVLLINNFCCTNGSIEHTRTSYTAICSDVGHATVFLLEIRPLALRRLER